MPSCSLSKHVIVAIKFYNIHYSTVSTGRGGWGWVGGVDGVAWVRLLRRGGGGGGLRRGVWGGGGCGFGGGGIEHILFYLVEPLFLHRYITLFFNAALYYHTRWFDGRRMQCFSVNE